MSKWHHLIIPSYKFWWGSDRGPASEQNSVVLQSAVTLLDRVELGFVDQSGVLTTLQHML